MKLNVERMGDVAVFRLSGQMTIGEGDIQFRQAVTEQLMRGDKKLLIDMKGLKYLDSAGLGEMVRAFTTVRKAGGSMRLLHLLDKAREVRHVLSVAAGLSAASYLMRSLMPLSGALSCR